MVRPKKHLGQHFLTDRNIAGKIVAQVAGEPERVCELGPGTGILTGPLLELDFLKELILLEIDKESVEYLHDHFQDERLKVVEADFLKTELSDVFSESFTLIGNFPYNISSQIFFKVLEYRNLVPEVVGMIQKEVAERIVAKPGNKTYGILSVLLQTWYDVTYCFTVNEGVFHPPPKVKSAVIRLERNKVQRLGCDEALYFSVVKMAFGKRRKTLRNALRPLLKDSMMDDALLNLRAEQLDKNQFEELTALIAPA
jgi:16S rRNA (adenine1518-N6/adenine1519-N6)-dimethyltransferase